MKLSVAIPDYNAIRYIEMIMSFSSKAAQRYKCLYASYDVIPEIELFVI